MKKSTISKEWIDWINLNKSRGCNPVEMFGMVVNGGNSPHETYELIFGSEKQAYKHKNWTNFPTNSIQLEDKLVDIVFQCTDPEIIIFNNFLSHEECDDLISLSEKRLVKSQVVDTVTGGSMVHPGRTSNNSFYKRGETELIAKIEKRISQLVGVPVNNGEGLQVLNYPPEKQYKPHYDYFSSKNGEAAHLRMGGQRIGTFIMYLNDVEAGGETTFPLLNMKVGPKKGNALFFSFTNDAGETDTRSLHAGSPVITGNKWISTKWLRQNSFEE